MALEVRPMDTRLLIQFDMGLNPKGGKIIRSKSISKVKESATDQDVYDVASALAGLQQYPVVAIRKVDQAELVNV